MVKTLSVPQVRVLVRLHRKGKLNRPGRGIYTLPDANVTERHFYAQVAKRFREGVICLLSASRKTASRLRAAPASAFGPRAGNCEQGTPGQSLKPSVNRPIQLSLFGEFGNAASAVLPRGLWLDRALLGDCQK